MSGGGPTTLQLLVAEAAAERGAGADWIAYREGGTDALTDLISRCADAATAVRSE